MRHSMQCAIALSRPETHLDRLRLGLLASLLGAAFLLGGSARSDVASLLVLRPLTTVIFVVAVPITLSVAWRRAPLAVAIGGAALLLCLFQLVPLPPEAWGGLSGREIAMDVYRVAGMPPPWHGLTLTPHYTWNAVFFLLAPLSALLLTLSLKPPQIRSVLAILIGLAILNAAIGILQSLGTPLLHFYEVTNREFAVGLLANRNHAAVSFACTLPLLATCTAAKGNGQAGWPMGILVAMIAALLLVPLIMLTGSRAGLAWVALALPMTLWVCGHEAGAGRLAAASPWIGAVAVLVVAAIFLVEERAPALLRLAQTGGVSELRLNAVPTIWKAIGDYWPWGSGIGSFPEIYAIYEPSHLLGVAHLNHAHNDLLELLLTGGLPAMLLVAAGGASLVRAAVSASRTSSPGGGEADAPAWARAGMSIVILLSLASLFDYPVRTPALAVLLAVAAALVARRNPPPPDINGAVHHDPSELPSVRRRGAYPRGADRPTVRNPA